VPEEPLQTTARIVSPIDPRAYRAELPNGKPTVAHLPRRLIHLGHEIQPGTTVSVEISPYDLDRARISGFPRETSS
jgi:translation initiation factor IF-1